MFIYIYIYIYIYVFIYIQTHNLFHVFAGLNFAYLSTCQSLCLLIWVHGLGLLWGASNGPLMGFLNFGSVQRVGLVGVWDAGVEDFGAFGFGA